MPTIRLDKYPLINSIPQLSFLINQLLRKDLQKILEPLILGEKTTNELFLKLSEKQEKTVIRALTPSNFSKWLKKIKKITGNKMLRLQLPALKNNAIGDILQKAGINGEIMT